MTKPKSGNTDARSNITESWLCIDCGINTAPGCSNRIPARTSLAFFGAEQEREGRRHANVR